MRRENKHRDEQGDEQEMHEMHRNRNRVMEMHRVLKLVEERAKKRTTVQSSKAHRIKSRAIAIGWRS